jgi:beta-phosphoglucomutase
MLYKYALQRSGTVKMAVIFDLDGVIVSTDKYHYLGWKKITEQEDIFFNETINERLRGVSRMESLEIILENAKRTYSEEEKVKLANAKNEYYISLLNELSSKDILPGVMKLLKNLKSAGVKIAIGSSSKNASAILKKIGLEDYFDAVADGNHIKKSKPDPEVFLLAATFLNMSPEKCIVVEDATSGVDAAIAANMKCVGVGSNLYNKATLCVKDLTEISITDLEAI